MLSKRIVCGGLALMLGAMLAAVPAVAADKSDLAGRAATWEKEYNAGNLAAVQALYAGDASRLPPNTKVVQGSAAILEQLKGLKDKGPKVKIAVTSAESDGDVAYGMGTYEILGADGSHVDHGKWLNVSKKSNGTWKIQNDMYSSDMPAAMGDMKMGDMK